MQLPRFSVVWMLVAALFLLTVASQAAPRLLQGDGLNLRLQTVTVTKEGVEVVASPERPGFAHNWFAGRLTEIVPGTSVVLKVAMAGNDTRGNRADVGKWSGLNPVYSYADPTRYESYVGYSRDESGDWHCDDALVGKMDRFAGGGLVPQQSSVPASLAREFLSADGRYWFPWRTIEDVAVQGGNVFRMSARFASSTVCVAMRVPYTSTYLREFTTRLKQAQFPGVYVDEIGKTAFGRPVECIRVEDPTGLSSPKERRTVVVFAREHATEHDSSWAVQGMLRYLLESTPETDELRSHTTYLLVPIQDIDGAVISRFAGLTEAWFQSDGGLAVPEIFAYARYFRAWVDAGRTLDVCVSLHNVEAGEAENLTSPIVSPAFESQTLQLNRAMFDAAKDAGYLAGKPQSWGKGLMEARLYGWIAKNLGAMDVAYEVNGCYPKRRLTTAQLQFLGAVMAREIGSWISGVAGKKRHLEAVQFLKRRDQEREVYFAEKGMGATGEKSNYDLLVKGY